MAGGRPKTGVCGRGHVLAARSDDGRRAVCFDCQRLRREHLRRCKVSPWRPGPRYEAEQEAKRAAWRASPAGVACRARMAAVRAGRRRQS